MAKTAPRTRNVKRRRVGPKLKRFGRISVKPLRLSQHPNPQGPRAAQKSKKLLGPLPGMPPMIGRAIKGRGGRVITVNKPRRQAT